MIKKYHLIWGIIAPLTLCPVTAQASSVFWVAGWLEEDLKKTKETVRIFKVDGTTKTVLASTKIPFRNGMLSGNGAHLFIISKGKVLELSTKDLHVRRQIRVDVPSLPILDNLFVHPRTGLIYLTSPIPSSPRTVIVVNPNKPSDIKELTSPQVVRGGFTFDSKRDRIYVGPDPLFAIDAKTHRFVDILDLQRLMRLLQDTKFSQVKWPRQSFMFPLANSNLLFWLDVEIKPSLRRPVLAEYDPDKGIFLRSELLILESPQLYGSASLSPDGKRLIASMRTFAMAGTEEGVIIDAETLAILHHVTFPEPVDHFVPAPDRQGMWIVTRSGKVYRLDDHTGEVLEQVPLPFRVRQVITSP